MKAFKLELLVLDFENYGAEQVRMIAENARGISPYVMSIAEADIGEWSDDHPLNRRATADVEFARLFSTPPAAPSEVQMPPEFIDKLKSIADWMDSSVQQPQISPEEFAYVNQFDYELAQAASEIYGIIGALPGSTPDAAQGGA